MTDNLFQQITEACVLPNEISILPNEKEKSYYWEWGGEKREGFDTIELALIDWIDRKGKKTPRCIASKSYSKKGVQARYLLETVEVTVKKLIGSDGSKINRRKMQQS